MAEITGTTAAPSDPASAATPRLTAVQEKFILHWGEMGTRWGINRTVAQIHALLYLSPDPLNAEDIVDTLKVARSNVSNSLKELQGWNIVHRVPVLGDRRDHFATTTDVWTMFQTILDERKRREIDPTRQLLAECLAEAEASPDESRHTRERLQDMRDMVEQLTHWYAQFRDLPTGAMVRFVKMGSKVFRSFGKSA